jgi:hypothetical protein
VNARDWLHGVRSPAGVMHLRDVRARNGRTLCGVAAVGNAGGQETWREFTRFRPPTCERCIGALGKREQRAPLPRSWKRARRTA